MRLVTDARGESESFMDERQQRIHDALMERRPELAEMYSAALQLLQDEPQRLGARTRISHVCHSMREVMNRVLGAMGRPSAPRVKPSTKQQMQDLPDLLAKYPDLALDDGGDLVQIPGGIATAMDQLFKAAVQEKRRSRDDVASLLTDDGNTEHTAVARWIESRTFFTKWAHLHDHQVAAVELPEDEVIRAHIGVFEALFDGVITEFFTIRHSIDDLLAEINSFDESDDA